MDLLMPRSPWMGESGLISFYLSPFTLFKFPKGALLQNGRAVKEAKVLRFPPEGRVINKM